MAPSVLIINPNSTEGMTQGLEKLVTSLDRTKLKFSFFTAPSGPASVNDDKDAEESAKHCVPRLTDHVLNKYDAFIVACYSKHPLVEWLQERPVVRDEKKVVWGIFQASVHKSTALIKGDDKYGILSTGKVWETILAKAVAGLDDKRARKSFAGVVTTGLNAKELHDLPPGEVAAKMKESTKELLNRGGVMAICLGCAGMAGLDKTVREACVEKLGDSKGKSIHIVDGVVAAIDAIEEGIVS